MRLLLLLSEGLDSPVAGHMMMKKCPVDAIHFMNHPEHKIGPIVERLCKLHDTGMRVFLLDYRQVQERLKKYEDSMRCILCKRLMYLISQGIALEKGYQAIVTGDSIGQVASQTVPNLMNIQKMIRIPVFQPLIGFNKEETTKLAREIGTYKLSRNLQCPYVSKNPKTKSRIQDLTAPGMSEQLDELTRIGIQRTKEVIYQKP